MYLKFGGYQHVSDLYFSLSTHFISNLRVIAFFCVLGTFVSIPLLNFMYSIIQNVIMIRVFGLYITCLFAETQRQSAKSGSVTRKSSC